MYEAQTENEKLKKQLTQGRMFLKRKLGEQKEKQQKQIVGWKRASDPAV